ncbi:MAG: hypothetical protein C0524_16705 [Rhodobacter sp.]|nr:hypothetical protein [Rhodobacter sp.]
MDLLNLALFWLHFMALALGGVASFGIPLLAARIPGADPAGRPALGQAIQLFSKIGSAAVGTLVLTGIIMTFTRIGGFSGQSLWFYLKLALVVALLGVIVINKRLGARAMKGDAQAAQQAAMMAKLAIALLASVVATAVLAFD